MDVTLGKLLRKVTSTATGCTEPGAIAFASAAAARLIDAEVHEIRLAVDSYTFKNASGVTIPGTDGATGVEMASAMGALIRDPSRKLELLSDSTPDIVEGARRLVSEGRVKLDVLRDRQPIYIDVLVNAGNSMARALVKGTHTGLVRLEVDGRAVMDSIAKAVQTRQDASPRHPLLDMSYREVISLTRDMSDEDMDYLIAGCEMNMALAEAGLRGRSGFGLGERLQRPLPGTHLSPGDVAEAKAYTAAAVEARMAGTSLPVQANSGSGNQGLLVTIPIVVLSRNRGTRRKELARALAIGHLFAGLARLPMGTLSTICGSAVAGAIGATAGILYLTADEEAIADLIPEGIRIIVSALSGVFCPGAGPACAVKLYVAAGLAVEAASLACQGLVLPTGSGLADRDAEVSLQSTGQLSHSMGNVHETMLRLVMGEDWQ